MYNNTVGTGSSCVDHLWETREKRWQGPVTLLHESTLCLVIKYRPSLCNFPFKQLWALRLSW